MNRPTRNTLFGCGLCLAIAAAAGVSRCSSAGAQVDEAGTGLIRQFNNCVLTASLSIPGERNAAAEMAFEACRTEEQAIRFYLSGFNLPRGNVDSVIITRKLELKKTILQDKQ